MKFGQLGHLVAQDMAGLVPLSPEEKHHTFVRADLLDLLQLLQGFNFCKEGIGISRFVSVDRDHHLRFISVTSLIAYILLRL